MSQTKKSPARVELYSTLEIDYTNDRALPEVLHAGTSVGNYPRHEGEYAENLNSGASQVADHHMHRTAVPLSSFLALETLKSDEKEAWQAEAPRNRTRKRRLWVISGLALLGIIILAAVLGGVLPSRSKSTKDTNIIGGIALLKGHTIAYNASIAAAIYKDDQAVQHRALFIQNASNHVLHLDWSSATNAWTLRNELAVFQSSGKIPTPKAGTPLAATGISSVNPQGIFHSSIQYPGLSLWFLDNSNQVTNYFLPYNDSSSWQHLLFQSNSSRAQPTAAHNSGLTAIALNYQIYVAFQDVTGPITLYNTTTNSSGLYAELDTLPNQNLKDFESGTPLAMFFWNNTDVTRMYLFYGSTQSPNGSLHVQTIKMAYADITLNHPSGKWQDDGTYLLGNNTNRITSMTALMIPRSSAQMFPPTMGVFTIANGLSSWTCNGQATSSAMENNGGMCSTETWQPSGPLPAEGLNGQSQLSRDGNYHLYTTNQYGVAQYSWTTESLSRTAFFNITSRPKST